MKIHCAHDEMVDVSKLKPHPKNRNKHPDAQIERLAEILNYQGFRYPIKVSKLSGFITSGHGRLLAAKKLGLKKVPVNFQPYESKAQEYADLQADNAIALWAELDLENIGVDVKELGKGFDLEMLGFQDFNLGEDAIAGKCDEDEIPEKVPAKTKLGDLYELDSHRLLCGDSTDLETVERLMNGKKADMVFTDPPYGMNLDTNYDTMFGNDSSHVKKGNRFQKVRGDDIDYDPNPIFSIQAKDYFIWGCDYFYDKLPAKGSIIAWDKRDENLDRVPGNTTEFCWSKNPKRRMSIRLKWSGHHGMQSDDTKTRVHPTQKPAALAEWFFEQWGKEAKTVVDIYGGSGSTLIACEKTQRKCFMMELDPRYCDVIVARWEKFTGKKAKLITKTKTILKKRPASARVSAHG